MKTIINLTKAGCSLLLVLLLEPLAIAVPTAVPNCILLPVFVYDANPPLLNIFSCMIVCDYLSVCVLFIFMNYFLVFCFQFNFFYLYVFIAASVCNR